MNVPLNILLNRPGSPTVDLIGKIKDIPSDAYSAIPKNVNIYDKFSYSNQ